MPDERVILFDIVSRDWRHHSHDHVFLGICISGLLQKFWFKNTNH